MTAVFEALEGGPQTGINIGKLSVDERVLVRSIQVRGTTGETTAVSVGELTAVYYLVGDERAAAERFVDENRAQLAQLDFSRRNLVSTSVDREVYDWILHALGDREIERYETVVIERRDEVTWCIGRRTYEETPMRRYTTAGSGSVRLDELSLRTLYDSLGETITVVDLREHPAIAGDVREVLDAFRQSSAFACRPITVGDELAIEKR